MSDPSGRKHSTACDITSNFEVGQSVAGYKLKFWRSFKSWWLPGPTEIKYWKQPWPQIFETCSKQGLHTGSKVHPTWGFCRLSTPILTLLMCLVTQNKKHTLITCSRLLTVNILSGPSRWWLYNSLRVTNYLCITRFRSAVAGWPFRLGTRSCIDLFYFNGIKHGRKMNYK